MLTYCFLALICLSGIYADWGKVSEDSSSSGWGSQDSSSGWGSQDAGWGSSTFQDQLPATRSCNPNFGTVCIPTACEKVTCSLFKEAVCVADRCGCEARFFNWMEGEKTYQDVSKMCSAANTVMNYINYTMAKSHDEDEDEKRGVAAKQASGEDEKKVQQFFTKFNLLITELLTDITEYLKIITKKSPTKANLDKLRKAVHRFAKLKRSARVYADEDAIQPKSVWTDIAKAGLNILSGLFDEDQKTSTVPVSPKLTAIGNAFKSDLDIFDGLISDEGDFADVVKSGNVVLSDTDLMAKLMRMRYPVVCVRSPCPGSKF